MATVVESPESSHTSTTSPYTEHEHHTLHHIHEHIDTIALALTGTTGVEQHHHHHHHHYKHEHEYEKPNMIISTSLTSPTSPTSSSTLTATASPTDDDLTKKAALPTTPSSPSVAPLPPSSSSFTPRVLFRSILNSLKEGGTQGWLAVLGSMLIHCFVFAPTEFIFGIFELHYQTIFPDSTPSSIAFVGTTGSAITYIAGFLSGLVADRFGFRPTAFMGAVVMALSLILASFSKQVNNHSNNSPTPNSNSNNDPLQKHKQQCVEELRKRGSNVCTTMWKIVRPWTDRVKKGRTNGQADTQATTPCCSVDLNRETTDFDRARTKGQQTLRETTAALIPLY